MGYSGILTLASIQSGLMAYWCYVFLRPGKANAKAEDRFVASINAIAVLCGVILLVLSINEAAGGVQ